MRYFLEVSYKGTRYAGFQIQNNANTIQGELEEALRTCLKIPVSLTGSSRTDAGVHALQNYFHFDVDQEVKSTIVYNLNSLLPSDIAVQSLKPVQDDAHCRFAALSREYNYFITSSKNPFRSEIAWFYPYAIEKGRLDEVANVLFDYTDFTSFSKRNTQVFTKECTIMKSTWYFNEGLLVYNVKANRFLRGMVRGLVGTMLLAGRGKISTPEFRKIIEARDCTKANFATPAHGLFLSKVEFPESVI